MGVRGTWLLAAALLAGCQEFGGVLGGSGATQSPREQRLQAIEVKLAEVTRKLDNLSLAAQAQNLARLEADARRGPTLPRDSAFSRCSLGHTFPGGPANF